MIGFHINQIIIVKQHDLLCVLRYLAVTRPVEYHINVTASGASPWRRVMRYMVPTVLFR